MLVTFMPINRISAPIILFANMKQIQMENADSKGGHRVRGSFTVQGLSQMQCARDV